MLILPSRDDESGVANAMKHQVSHKQYKRKGSKKGRVGLREEEEYTLNVSVGKHHSMVSSENVSAGFCLSSAQATKCSSRQHVKVPSDKCYQMLL